MATAVQVQYRRDSASNVAAFTGAAGEMIIDTTNSRVVVQDGATAGGFPAAKLSEVQTNTRTQVSDGNYTVLASDRTVAYITLTASRALSLPAANSYPTGCRLLIVDETGNCSAGETLTANASGSDLIDGASTAVINSAYGYLALECNGANKWTIVDQVGSAGGVSSLNSLTGALSIAANGGTITASGTTVTIGDCGGFVSKFRNCAMDVWQRGTSGSVTTSGGYAADGWIVTPTGAGVPWAQASGRLLTKNSLQVSGATSVTDVQMVQRIESLIAAALCSQTVTVQAQVYNGTGGSITPTLTVKRPSTQDGWSGAINTDVSAVSLQACPASAWTLVSYTFTANAGSYNGLQITFDFGNNFGANTKTVQLTECNIRVTPGVTTGLNNNPPPPELVPIAAELAHCQRYYTTSYGNGVAPGTSTSAGAVIGFSNNGDTNLGAYMLFAAQMRAAPTVSIWDTAGNSGKYSTITSGGSITTNQGAISGIFVSGPTGAFVAASTGSAANYMAIQYSASAEL